VISPQAAQIRSSTTSSRLTSASGVLTNVVATVSVSDLTATAIPENGAYWRSLRLLMGRFFEYDLLLVFQTTLSLCLSLLLFQRCSEISVKIAVLMPHLYLSARCKDGADAHCFHSATLSFRFKHTCTIPNRRLLIVLHTYRIIPRLHLIWSDCCHDVFTFYFVPGRSSKYCDQRVCVSVCLSACISKQNLSKC